MAARDERIAQLKRLVADGARDLGVARTLAAAVDECAQRAKGGDRPALFGTVYALESFYSACEDLFARIERTFATIPAGERWHHDLLLGMSQTLDGMRPAVLRTETMVLLMPYLDFRRAAKHAIYQQGPLWTLMSDRVDGVLRLWRPCRRIGMPSRHGCGPRWRSSSDKPVREHGARVPRGCGRPGRDIRGRGAVCGSVRSRGGLDDLR